MRWSFFFLGEYASMFVVCGIASILFLGGWDDGFGIVTSIDQVSGGKYVADVLGIGIFISKASFLLFIQIWVRWTLPRLRIDQVMTTCLKYLLPISCVLFAGAVVWPILLMGTGRTHWNPRPLGEQADTTAVSLVESDLGDAADGIPLDAMLEEEASGSEDEVGDPAGEDKESSESK